MPLYEYKCKKCGREFEFQQKISEEPLKNCIYDDCNGEVFRKISKNIGLVFNGSGFYLTDYVHKKDKPPTQNSNHKHSETTTNANESHSSEVNGSNSSKVNGANGNGSNSSKVNGTNGSNGSSVKDSSKASVASN